MKKLIYIAGPITGMPNENKENFARLQKIIEERGFKAINPHEIFKNIDTTGFTHRDYMRYCLQAMLNADLVVTLIDWHNSTGACMEVDLARLVDIPQVHEVRFIAETIFLNEEARTTSQA